uniref:Uncharacterized protein n=1 Tax=Aegilops tauschii TaxID=37682 RepID=M8CRJ2_AEGTA
MAIEMFFTTLVFCEAPLDGYGTSVLTVRTVNRLVSGCSGATELAATANKADAEKEQGFFSGKPTANKADGASQMEGGAVRGEK